MSLVPTREDQAFGAGYQQASETAGIILDHLGKRLREAETERDKYKVALEKLLFWNAGIDAGRGNYHCHDHLALIRDALGTNNRSPGTCSAEAER